MEENEKRKDDWVFQLDGVKKKTPLNSAAPGKKKFPFPQRKMSRLNRGTERPGGKGGDRLIKKGGRGENRSVHDKGQYSCILPGTEKIVIQTETLWRKMISSREEGRKRKRKNVSIALRGGPIRHERGNRFGKMSK